MAIAGKLIGALIGSIAGPFGTIFGGLVGHLFDRAVEERRMLNGAGARRPGRGPWEGSLSDNVSQAQINFLACLIGLSLAVAEIDGGVKTSHLGVMKDFFRSRFSFPSVDQDLLQKLIEEMYANRYRIDAAGLCAYYAAVSTPEDRVLLLRLLFQIARSDSRGISPGEEDQIRRMSVLLGMEDGSFRRVRAEFMDRSDAAWEIM